MKRYQSVVLALASIVSAFANPNAYVKRDSWGAAFSLGPAKHTIVKTETVIYPGAFPSKQQAYLFAWLGISNGSGDLIQSIVGSYPPGGSECDGPARDTAWCISSEVFGRGGQFVGDLRTAHEQHTNGVKLTYTLVDKATWMWNQTMHDATTGKLLSTYKKTSGPMLGWGTALECNNFQGKPCTGTPETQTYSNSSILLEEADPNFVRTLGAGKGVTHTDMTTADGGKTWTIQKITIPPMQGAPKSKILYELGWHL